MVEQNATALDLADEASVMERGRLVLTGPAVDVVGDPRVMQAFLGVAS